MMRNNIQQDNEQLTAEAFSRQSGIFDSIYASNTIVQYKRERVRAVVNTYLPKGGRILELNSGTGEDAIYFTKQGYHVHATDNSDGMLLQLKKKACGEHLETNISSERCSFTELGNLKDKGPYNMIFSNFAGLNCTGELQKVLQSFDPLLTENGLITLVILPPFCLWETLMALKGKFKTAFRRFNSHDGRKAHIEGIYFKCWYYSPSFVMKTLSDKFDVLGLEGLCTIMPPSYIEHFSEKHPKLFRYLKNTEDRLKSKWPWKFIGDYYIITLKKK